MWEKMLTTRVLLLVATLTSVIFAHPHPHHQSHTGECMEMRTSATRSGRTHWISNPFKCMKDIKLPREERLAKYTCGRKAHDFMFSFFKGDKIDDLKHKNLEEVKTKRREFFAHCMVKRLDLEASDGTLDAGKVLKNSLKMDSSDVSALMKMQTIVNICLSNSTGVNATEQFLMLRSCVRKLAQEQCTLNQQLLRAYLERGRDASEACANVSTHHQSVKLEELFDACMAEHAIKSAAGTNEQSVLASSNKGRFAQTMVSSKICVAEKMNWFSPETGFNGELYREFVSNFTWDLVPQGMDEVLMAMEECDAELEGSAYNQIHQWESCFVPKIVSICGFNNKVTKFFFPFINADIQKAALEYIEDLTDDDDDIMEDMDDYDDDYDYNDYDQMDDDYDDEKYDGNSYEDLDDEVDDDDDDDFGGGLTVDDGLLDLKLGPTILETEQDAMLVDGDSDDLKLDDGLKSKESVEDDAEPFMSRFQQKEENSPGAKQDSKNTIPENVSKTSVTEIAQSDLTTDIVDSTENESVTDSTEKTDMNDYEDEFSIEVTVNP